MGVMGIMGKSDCLGKRKEISTLAKWGNRVGYECVIIGVLTLAK